MCQFRHSGVGHEEGLNDNEEEMESLESNSERTKEELEDVVRERKKDLAKAEDRIKTLQQNEVSLKETLELYSKTSHPM